VKCFAKAGKDVLPGEMIRSRVLRVFHGNETFSLVKIGDFVSMHCITILAGLILFYGAAYSSDEEPSASISVSAVSGNTGTFGARASFGVSLGTEPSSDVSISMVSSDPGQGALTLERLVFTPENWFRSQQVHVRSMSEGLYKAAQDYSIVLSPAISADPNYEGIDAEDVPMRGYRLEILPPDQPLVVIPGVRSIFGIETEYTGGRSLIYSLISGPPGLTVHPGTGEIDWTPPMSYEGTTASVMMRVSNDVEPDRPGHRVSDQALFVEVRNTEILPTVVYGNLIRFGDSVSDLQGVILRFNDDTAEGRTLRRVEALPQELASTTRAAVLSDVFYSPEDVEGTVDVLIPLSRLPEGTESWSRLGLYSYRDNTFTRTWPTGMSRRAELIDGEPYSVVQFNSLQRLVFLAVRPKSKGQPLRKSR